VNSHLQNEARRKHGPERVKRVEVYWHAVTYKTLIVYGLLVGAAIFGAAYFATPGFYAAVSAPQIRRRPPWPTRKPSS